MTSNLIAQTDSYKPTQWRMYPEGTESVYSYFEARVGAEFDETVQFGVQYKLLKHLTGDHRVSPADVREAKKIFDVHLGPGVFNLDGWNKIIANGGRIPVRIWAQPEGTVHKPGTVLMIVENYGGGDWYWLTDYLETLLVQTWYPITVATKSRAIKKDIAEYMLKTTGSTDGIDFMLHDFGCRGATGMEAAGIGGMAHLVNFKGTDTVPALFDAVSYYNADINTLGFSVCAAQHSIMTALGQGGEAEVVGYLLDRHPTGILAAPIDSYDYINYVEKIGGEIHRDRILSRDGKFVFRPDSTSPTHPTPEEEMVWLMDTLWDRFGGGTNELGYKDLDPHVGVLWGDGLDRDGINKIMEATTDAGYAVTNYLFGMGGALLQKVNRDTQRMAFKCSAQLRNGEWVDIQKNPLDRSKASKTGRFDNLNLPLVFDDGKLMKKYNFEEVRSNAAI